MFAAAAIKPCPRNLTRLDDCIRDAIDELRPLLVLGDLGDGFHTLPLDPMRLDDLQLGRDETNFVARNTNVMLRGASTFVVDKLRYADWFIVANECQHRITHLYPHTQR